MTKRVNNELIYKISLYEKSRIQQHSMIMELRGSMRVFCRVKPIDFKDNSCLIVQNKEFVNSMETIELNNQRGENSIFHFDKVFQSSST